MAIEMQYDMNKKEKELIMKIDALRLKFLRLLRSFGNPEIGYDAVFERVLHRLGLLETYVLLDRIKPIDQEKYFLRNAIKKSQQVEDEESSLQDYSFSCSILVLGKTGVGKSSTINSIFNGHEGMVGEYTNPFIPATRSINEISGMVEGVQLHIFDTPGLKTSLKDQGANIRILKSIKKHIKSRPPDIVLYVDRIDTQTLDFNDLPLLRSISKILGSTIWFNTIIALTHAASDPPDGPDGSPLDYELFVAQRSHIVQQSIRRATAYNDHMNPLALVENHPCCKRNKLGEQVHPNGLNWRSQLLLQCYSSKIFNEADSHFRLGEKLHPGRFREFLSTHLYSPLPFLLPSLMQSREHLKTLTHNLAIESDMLCEPDIDLYDHSAAALQEADDFGSIALEQCFDVAGLHQGVIVAIIEKDKNMLIIKNFETSMAIDHSNLDGSTKLIVFKMQHIGEKLAYIFLGETKWKISKKKNIAAGISITFLGESIISGFKLEEQVLLENNSTSLVGSVGIMTHALTREIAYETKLEARFKDKAYPVGTPFSTFGFSVCKRQGDLSLETNMQSQHSFRRSSKLVLQVTSRNLNKGSITIKATTSSLIVGIFPVIFRMLYYIYSKL